MSDPARDFAPLIDRLDALFDRLEAVLPTPLPPTDWSATAFRWRTRGGRGWLEAVKQPHRIRFEDLQGVEDQKQRIAQNTRQFVAKRSANNVLLTGARGTGKSSLVKALLNDYAKKGLRLIEVDKRRSGRPARHHRPDRRPARALHHLLRRPVVRIRRAGLQGAEKHSRWFGHGRARQRAGLRDVEPPPPDAGIDVGKQRGEARRRRSASGRSDRREDFAVRALRPVAVLLPLRSGSVSGHRAPLAEEARCAAEQIEACRGDALRWTLERGSRSGRVAWQFAPRSSDARRMVSLSFCSASARRAPSIPFRGIRRGAHDCQPSRCGRHRLGGFGRGARRAATADFCPGRFIARGPRCRPTRRRPRHRRDPRCLGHDCGADFSRPRLAGGVGPVSTGRGGWQCRAGFNRPGYDGDVGPVSTGRVTMAM
jgi:hypothetical protein